MYNLLLFPTLSFYHHLPFCQEMAYHLWWRYDAEWISTASVIRSLDMAEPWEEWETQGKWEELYQTLGTQEHTYLDIFTFQVISWTECHRYLYYVFTVHFSGHRFALITNHYWKELFFHNSSEASYILQPGWCSDQEHEPFNRNDLETPAMRGSGGAGVKKSVMKTRTIRNDVLEQFPWCVAVTSTGGNSWNLLNIIQYR